ncbi:MAG: hypothetical protein ABFC57_15080 [Veillonellales bacterium]
MKKRLVTSIAMIIILGSTSSVFAAASEDYSAELAMLKQRMAQLEAKMQAQATNTKAVTKSDEKDNLKFSGDFRVRSVWNGGPATFQERVRLALTDKVNDNTTFYVRWAVMNNNQMGTTARYNDVLPNTSTDDDMSAQDRNIVSDAYMRVDNLFGTKNSVTMGRFGQDIGATGYWNSAGNIGLVDGIKFDTKVNDLKATVGFANWSPLASAKLSKKRVGSVTRPLQNAMFLNASYKVSNPTAIYWTYVKETNSSDSPINFRVSGPGIRTRISDDWSFRGDYLRNYAAEGNPLGEYFSLMYKGANDQRPHSWGVSLDYHYVQPNNIAYTLATSTQMQSSTDIKGPGITAHYSPDKNCMLDFYQTFNTKKASTGQTTANYSRFQIVYGF